MKIDLNADLIVVGDRVVHPLDCQPHLVARIQKAMHHNDYVNVFFEDGIAPLSVWRTSMFTVVRRFPWEKA